MWCTYIFVTSFHIYKTNIVSFLSLFNFFSSFIPKSTLIWCKHANWSTNDSTFESNDWWMIKTSSNATTTITIRTENPEVFQNVTYIKMKRKSLTWSKNSRSWGMNYTRLKPWRNCRLLLSLLSRLLSTSEWLTCLLSTCQMSKNKINMILQTIEFNHPFQPHPDHSLLL